MKKIFQAFMILSLLLLPVLVSAQSTQGIHYQYELTDGGSIDLYVAEQGIRVDVDREDEAPVNVIYRPSDDHLIVLQTDQKRATSLSRKQIKRSIQMMKTMRERLNKQLEQAPEGQREMMKKMMEEQMPDFKNPEDISTPTMKSRQATEWNGMSAEKGIVMVDGDTSGTVVTLNEAPVSVSEPVRRTMTSFQEFLRDMVKMVRAASQSGELSDALDRTELFVGLDQLRIANVVRDGQRLTLSSWENRSIPDQYFEIPGDYEVNSPEIGPSMNGSSGAGQR